MFVQRLELASFFRLSRRRHNPYQMGHGVHYQRERKKMTDLLLFLLWKEINDFIVKIFPSRQEDLFPPWFACFPCPVFSVEIQACSESQINAMNYLRAVIKRQFPLFSLRLDRAFVVRLIGHAIACLWQ